MTTSKLGRSDIGLTETSFSQRGPQSCLLISSPGIISQGVRIGCSPNMLEPFCRLNTVSQVRRFEDNFSVGDSLQEGCITLTGLPAYALACPARYGHTLDPVHTWSAASRAMLCKNPNLEADTRPNSFSGCGNGCLAIGD